MANRSNGHGHGGSVRYSKRFELEASRAARMAKRGCPFCRALSAESGSEQRCPACEAEAERHAGCGGAGGCEECRS
jgi:hypothetical protein